MPFGLTNDFKEEINGKITLISSSGISKISIEQVTNGKQLVKSGKFFYLKLQVSMPVNRTKKVKEEYFQE